MSRGMLGGTGAPGVMVVAELDPLQKSMQALTLKLVGSFATLGFPGFSWFVGFT